MNKPKILHITPWFPNENNSTEGIFVWEHIKSLSAHTINEIISISFSKEKKFEEKEYEGVKHTEIRLKPLIDKWIFKERSASKQVAKILAKRHKEFDLINFHIAYPNAISIDKLKSSYPNLKFVITEHWTAYRYNFHLSEDNKGRKRIEQIFHHNIPVITVSTALAEDIQNFSKTTGFDSHIVPNVIRTDIFSYKEKTKKETFRFSSINNWNPMKNPITLIKAFHKVALKNPNIELVFAGTGDLIPEMNTLVKTLGLTDKVIFLGRISKQKVAEVLFNSDVYVQCSNYETFSVISAEALATGTPVITTKIGGVLDFIDDSNGILVEGMDIDNWAEAMEASIAEFEQYDLLKISQNAHNRFNLDAVGETYSKAITSIINEG